MDNNLKELQELIEAHGVSLDEYSELVEELAKESKKEDEEAKKDSKLMKICLVFITFICATMMMMVILPVDKTDQQECFNKVSTCSDKQLDVYADKVVSDMETYG